jgi:cysteinyl-tRNA synthetase, unknown class
MAASRAVAINADRAMPLQRPAAHARRPLLRTALRPFRPQAMRAQARALRSHPSFRFGVMLAASALAGAIATVVQWRDDSGLVPELARTAALSDRPETTVYRAAPARDRSARGWESMESEGERGPPSNFPRRVKTVTFTPPGEMTAAIPPADAVAPTDALPRGTPLPPLGLSKVKSWRYQLQNINPGEIASSSSDLVVIDYSTDDAPFSKAQIERMKQKPDGSRRIVLSYMSIGEAENYRWYWSQRSSSWLGGENRQWRGNYSVRFWHPGWQEIIFTYTDRILAAGFDGVYLDKVDEYETMGHRDEMVEFVARIAARAKAQRSDFLVVSQNGDPLLSDAKFRHAIDGFAREDLFYGEDGEGKRNGSEDIRDAVRHLKMFAAEGKPVFVVEYPRNDAQAQTARREISEHGFIGLIAKRSLGAL